MTAGTKKGATCCGGFSISGKPASAFSAGWRGAARPFPEQLEACEIAPPPGEPLHWRLLTTHAVTSLADAKWIIGLYCRRWVIQQVFRVMITHGLDIEAATDSPGVR